MPCCPTCSTIPQLADHTDLHTTRRYMHLAPAALREAIGLLALRAPGTHLAPTKAAAGNRKDSETIENDPTGT
jgi:hypothetical protein